MIAFFEIIYRLFGVENYLAFQIVNTICIVLVIFLLHKISQELFEDKRMVKATSIMSMMLLPFFMFSTLVYGDIPGFTLGVCAIYYSIRYLKTNQWKYVLFIGLFFMFGLIIKGNNLIFVVALSIALLLKTLQDKKWKRLVAIAAIFIMSQVGTYAVDQVYVKRAGIEEFPKGTPKLSWVAMGLQETDETGNGCGWYNGYNLRIYEECNHDYDLAVEKSKESIKESIVHFTTHPGRAVYYFYRKFVSQWNDPSFQSQIMNEWYSRHTDDPSEWTHYLLYEGGRTRLFQIQNVLHMVVFFFVAIGSVVLLKKWSFERAYYVLNIFGGIFFHMLIWESKGRYVLVYYVLMIPIAALGYQTFGEEVIAWIQKAKEYRNDKREQKAI